MSCSSSATTSCPRWSVRSGACSPSNTRSPTEPIPDQALHADQTTAAVRSLFAVVEAYPEVKSGANVLDLQDEIERLESMIADRRELYNDQVYRYNTRISTLPTLPLAWVFGWAPREFFAARPDETARPDVSLGSGEEGTP
jgi:LemA protein